MAMAGGAAGMGHIDGAQADDQLIADPIVAKAIRGSLKKPEGKFTKADLAKVTDLDLTFMQITNASL